MILAGLARLGNEPEIRYTPDGKAVMDLSLAFAFGKKGNDGNRPTQWITATMWGDRVTKLASHLTKGQQLFVTLSEPHVEEFNRKDGTKGFGMRARLNEMEFAGAPKNERSVVSASTGAETDFSKDLDMDIPF